MRTARTAVDKISWQTVWVATKFFVLTRTTGSSCFPRPAISRKLLRNVLKNSVDFFRAALSAVSETVNQVILFLLHFPADWCNPTPMGSDENDAGKGQGSIGQSGPVEPPAADGDKGQRTEEDNKRYENQKIRRALHFSCIGGIQRLRHLIIYSHLKKNTIADTCSEECIGEDCPQAYPAEENGRQQQQ